MLINQNQISPDAMSCNTWEDRLSAFVLGCIPTQSCHTPAGWHRRLPDLLIARQGVGVRACTWQTQGNRVCRERAELCSRTDGTGENSEHFSLLLSPPDLAALAMWENYKPTCCVMLFSFFLPPPQDLLQTFHVLASALLPSMKRVIIRLASNWKRWGFRTHPALKS